MYHSPQQIENRNWSLIPLVQGCDFESSKAIVAPGTLQDCMNYEVNSLGYERSQGLFLYNGTYDRAIDNMWYVADTAANATFSGSFTLGGRVTWANGEGVCIYIRDDVDVEGIGLVDIEGEVPDTATVFTDVTTTNTFTLTDTRRGELLVDPKNEQYTNDPDTGIGIADTITKYLAFITSVNTAITSEASSGWPYFKPKIPGTGRITGGFQFNDAVYAVRDYFSIQFDFGENEPDIGDIITVGTFVGKMAAYELNLGYFEDENAIGFLYLRPHDGGTFDESVWQSQVVQGTTITNTTKGVTLGEVRDAPGVDDRQKGLLWKATTEGWQEIDTGYSLRFQNGENAPNARVTPLYLSDSVDAVQDTGWVLPTNAATSGSSSYSVWNNIGNALVDDGNYTSSVLDPGEESEVYEVFWDNIINASFTDILGVEIRIEASATAVDSIRPITATLVDNGGISLGTFQFESLNLASNEYLTTTDDLYVYGGQTDLWGFAGKTVEDFNDGGLRFRIKCVNDDGSTQTARIDHISAKVHYVSRGQRVFLHDPLTSTDVAEGDVYSYDLLDGDWVDDNAFGWMSFHDIDDPTAVKAGLEIRTEESGGGTLIAETNSQLRYNLLPGRWEMDREDAQWTTITANFFENEDGQSVYGATGASPLFQFDKDDHFSFIRLPVSPDQDKPRHVGFHKNHLVCSVGSHILISVVGSPTDFNTVNDAVTFGVRDPVVGLQPLPGDAMGVLCEESIHALSGTYFNEFQVQNITPRSGAIEYTSKDVMGPLYADYNGISNVNVTAAFGDFKTRPYTAAIYKWMSRRHQKNAASLVDDTAPIAAVAVRSKNQYRLYYEDGYIVSLGLPQGSRDAPKPMLGHYDPVNLGTDYVPTWIDSTILSDGRERVVMGTTDGCVWIVDGANGIQTDAGLTEVDCWFTINPVNLGFLQGSHATKSVTVYGDFMSAQSLTYSSGGDYLPPTSTELTKTLGDYDDAPILEAEVGYTDLYPRMYTDGFSMTIKTSMDGSKPHRFHSLLQRANTKGAGRNNTQKSRG